MKSQQLTIFFILSLLIWQTVTSQTSVQSAKTVFENKMISSGNNFPAIDIRQNHLTQLCVDLHRGMTLETIRRELNLSESELSQKLDQLKRADLVKENADHRFVPNFMVVTMSDATNYLRPSKAVVEETVDLILGKLPEIRRQYQDFPGLRNTPFEKASLFILSDVMLDNWQIRNVESLFLKSERPLRAGKHFYFALLEKPSSMPTEAFGIYGNASSGLGNVSLSAYGNRRYDGHNLISASDQTLNSLFKPGGASPPGDIRRTIALRLVELASGGGAPREDEREGLKQLGLIDNGQLNYIVIREQEETDLGKVSGLITNDLVSLLEKHRPELESAYRKSPYGEQVTFNEYFMWWYHFYYTVVTNRLAERGAIKIPNSGVITYLVKP